MDLQARAAQAIDKLGGQLQELKNLKTQDPDETLELIKRWYKRAQKAIATFVNIEEAKEFDEYSHNRIVSSRWEVVSGAVDYYTSKLNAFISELKTHPDSILDPTQLEMESPSSNDSIFKMLHPDIVKVSKDEFNDEYFSNSVFSAFKNVNNRVKAHYKSLRAEELDGKRLMTSAFSDTNPAVTMGDLQSESGRNMQEGYRFIFAGSMLAIRNPKAHDHVEIDKTRAIHFLFLASLEMHKLDEAKIPRVGIPT